CPRSHMHAFGPRQHAVVVALFCWFVSGIAAAQNPPAITVPELTYHGKSLPLRDLWIYPSQPARVLPVRRIPLPFSALAAQQRDPVEQRTVIPAVATTPGKNFAGLGKSFPGFVVAAIPSDTNLSVG